MKRVKWIVVFIGIMLVLCIFFGGIISILLMQTKEEEVQQVESQMDSQETEEELLPEQVVKDFFAVVYNYDTNERPFYVGADVYMTDDAYASLIPAGMELEEEQEVNISMISELDSYDIYSKKDGTYNVDMMAEIWFRVSGTGEFRLRQIVKLQLYLDGKWMISNFEVIDTMEE